MNAYDLLAGDEPLYTIQLLTAAMGGSAAYQAGKAIAQTWRPYWHVPAYGLILAAGVRFCHYALFAEPLLSMRSYLVEFVVTLIAASLGYRMVRTRQMVTQYAWLYRRAFLLGWRRLS